MGLTAAQIAKGVRAVAKVEPAIARAVKRAGMPDPRIRDRGATTLLRTIIGQQVSVAAATSIWNRFEAAVGPGVPLNVLLDTPVDALRACGLSGQKVAYCHSLAQHVVDGGIDFDALPADDEEAIRLLTSIKGIGRWSAEIYLLFAEGRPDIWPAGDLAVQEAVGRILELDARPTERVTRQLSEPWSPHRGAIAIFAWHCYNKGVI